MSIGDEPIIIDFSSFEDIVLIKGENRDRTSNISNNSNGSGKSTISDALVFALYGKTPRGQKVENIINRYTKKNLHVEIEFDNMKIVRKRNPTSLEFFIDNQDNTLSSMPLTQKLIEDKIGINYDTFINIFCFGQYSSFDFISSSIAAKRSLIENMLGLEQYSKCETIVKKLSLI